MKALTSRTTLKRSRRLLLDASQDDGRIVKKASFRTDSDSVTFGDKPW